MNIDTNALDGLPLADLEAAYEKLSAAIDKKLSLSALQQQAESIATRYEEAVVGRPSRDWVPGLVVGPGEKVVEGGVEYRNVSHAWLSASPSQYPLGYARTVEPPGPVELWATGQAVTKGDLRRHLGVVYLCQLSHTTQDDWAPHLPGMTALWTVAVAPAGKTSTR